MGESRLDAALLKAITRTRRDAWPATLVEEIDKPAKSATTSYIFPPE